MVGVLGVDASKKWVLLRILWHEADPCLVMSCPIVFVALTKALSLKLPLVPAKAAARAALTGAKGEKGEKGEKGSKI